MKKIKQLTIITAMFALVLPTVILADSIPIPESFSVRGNVVIDGENAPIGTVILVEESNEEIANTTVGIAGKYLVEISTENIGKTLTYKVDKTFTTSEVAVTVVNSNPSYQEINLSVTTTELNPASPYCGDGNCDVNETCSSCSTDCGACDGGVGGSSTPPELPELPEVTPKEGEVKGVEDINIIDGDIIQCASSSNPFAVYIVKIVGDTKYIRHIVSLEIFNYYGHLQWENLKQVDSLDAYSLSGWARVNTGPNGTPGPTDKVYEINGDQSKHWINMTAEDFLSHGGSEQAIYSVNQGELDLYITGPDVMSL